MNADNLGAATLRCVWSVSPPPHKRRLEFSSQAPETRSGYLQTHRRVRSHRRFRDRGTKPLRESGAKWMSGGAKWMSGDAKQESVTEPQATRAPPSLHRFSRSAQLYLPLPARLPRASLRARLPSACRFGCPTPNGMEGDAANATAIETTWQRCDA
jgi:hypothetical protein